ncbi:hypothetical protein LCD52_12700 [Rossellomorea vietnamensis]|uniref:hypothetical protein n=1 Tax=Rossellomorea vietnamensis TaxID=218284 RepID=UPI001CCC7DF0|nr:hypothetical protein [Rossellomorea vietnamensis]MCA0149654.1 hypothetical protein [Rossellomorea vietnamensis]
MAEQVVVPCNKDSPWKDQYKDPHHFLYRRSASPPLLERVSRMVPVGLPGLEVPVVPVGLPGLEVPVVPVALEALVVLVVPAAEDKSRIPQVEVCS